MIAFAVHIQEGCFQDEHTCGDGLCIYATRLCDGFADCHDKSDEIGCETGTVFDLISEQSA